MTWHILGYIFSAAIGVFTIMGVLIGVIFTNIRGRVDKSEGKIEDLDIRTTKLETEKKHELDRLQEKMNEMQQELKDLKAYVHEAIHKERGSQQIMIGMLRELNEKFAEKIK